MNEQAYLAYVDGIAPDKDVKFKQLNWRGRTPPTGLEIAAKAKVLIGDDRPFLVLYADYPENLDDRLREAGFENKFDFIRSFGKVV